MKCQVGKGSFGVVWKGLYKENPVAVKLFISEEIDIRGEVYAMSKVVGLEHVMDLIGKLSHHKIYSIRVSYTLCSHCQILLIWNMSILYVTM